MGTIEKENKKRKTWGSKKNQQKIAGTRFDGGLLIRREWYSCPLVEKFNIDVNDSKAMKNIWCHVQRIGK